MWTASAWKSWYAEERATLGERGLSALVERAPGVSLPSRGALVFPHTRLAISGELVAAAARAVVESGADRVVALGVLHGARAEDRALVEAARLGDSKAAAKLRRVHGGLLSSEASYWSEEFSLDGFTALLEVAARRAGRATPTIVARYPFLVGDDPASLFGMDALMKATNGCALVATTDPMHHGVGYGTDPSLARDPSSSETIGWVRGAIAEQLDALGSGDYAAFQRLAALHRSDFRDTGPVLAHVLRRGGAVSFEQHALTLVDYADVLPAPRPTWVAAALVSARAA